MGHRQHGFTLVELMIVIGIIAVVAAIAIPNLLAARLSANETAAIATLRNLSGAQAQFQQRARIDGDADGVGEYGFFAELSGGAAGRMAAALSPAVFSAAFQAIGASGEVTRSGYLFLLYLPDASGAGVDWTALADVEANLAETTWCAYAWPVNHGQTGNRTFFVNQAGDVVAMDAGAGVFDGPIAGGKFPAADAAYRVPNDIVSPVDVGGPGQTGVAAGGPVWVAVN